jgi:phospholipid:diacylglycerol acyltransferase
MNILRRRNAGDGRRSPSPTHSVEGTDDEGDTSARDLHRLVRIGTESSKRRSFWTFALGGFFGIVVAIFFIGHNEIIDFAGMQDFSLDSILDVLPAGMWREAKEFQVSAHLVMGKDTDRSLQRIATRESDG